MKVGGAALFEWAGWGAFVIGCNVRLNYWVPNTC